MSRNPCSSMSAYSYRDTNHRSLWSRMCKHHRPNPCKLHSTSTGTSRIALRECSRRSLLEPPRRLPANDPQTGEWQGPQMRWQRQRPKRETFSIPPEAVVPYGSSNQRAQSFDEVASPFSRMPRRHRRRERQRNFGWIGTQLRSKRRPLGSFVIPNPAEKAAHTLPAPWLRLGGTKMRSSQRSSPLRQPLRVVRAISVQPLVRNWEHPDAIFSECQTKTTKKTAKLESYRALILHKTITSDDQRSHGIPRDANCSESDLKSTDHRDELTARPDQRCHRSSAIRSPARPRSASATGSPARIATREDPKTPGQRPR